MRKSIILGTLLLSMMGIEGATGHSNRSIDTSGGFATGNVTFGNPTYLPITLTNFQPADVEKHDLKLSGASCLLGWHNASSPTTVNSDALKQAFEGQAFTIQINDKVDHGQLSRQIQSCTLNLQNGGYCTINFGTGNWTFHMEKLRHHDDY